LKQSRNRARGQERSGALKRGEVPINWVVVAVELSGGVQSVARKMGVSRWTVYKWMKHGTVRSIAYEKVVQLQQLSGVSAEHLTQEWRPAPVRRRKPRATTKPRA
jgi:DNA-binding transcriptional regulator YdaS (Cro superfamily)